MIKIAFVGDIMPGGIAYNDNKNFVDDKLVEYLNTFDLRVGNLESAIGDNLSFDPIKMNNDKWQNVIYAKNKHLLKLKKLNIDIVSIANNHILDLGEEGLNNTIKQLNSLGIKYFGAGVNKIEASKPLIVSLKEKKIAFLGYSSPNFWAPHEPSDNNYGVNQFYINKVIEDVSDLKKICNYVFVMPHWGDEHTHIPNRIDYFNSKKIITAGADGIIGGHSHQIQPYFIMKKKPVFFSLGNFYFPDRFIVPPRSTWYPEDCKTIDIDELPREYGYPFVDELTLKLWTQKANTGMIAEFYIVDERISIKSTLSKLGEDNILHIKKHTFIDNFILNSIKLAITLTGVIFFKFIALCRIIKLKIKR